MKRLLATFGVACCGFGAGSLWAQTTYIWTGNGVNADVTTAANWQGGTVPAGLSTDTLVFGTTVNQLVVFPAPQTVGNLVFNGVNTAYFVISYNPGTVLTLAGGISSPPPSSFYAGLAPDLLLPAGAHAINTEGVSVYLLGAISGTGSIVKTGSGSLGLNGNSSFAGGVTINQGMVFVSSNTALGTGTVTVNGGTLALQSDTPVTLANAVALGANPSFDLGWEAGPSLTLTGTIAATGSATNLSILGNTPLYLSGNIVNGPAGATAYTFSGGGLAILSGNNTYTGGTTIGTETTRAGVVFGTSAAIPSTNSIKSTALGYAGLAAPSAVGTFLGKLDPASFHGTVGFDTPLGNPPQVFSSAINLSGLSDSLINLGTISEAILTGAITPPSAASVYNFGGAGWLFLRNEPTPATPNPLGGARDLRAVTLPGTSGATEPFMLVVSRGNNTYSGETIASGGGIVFDAPGALPTNSILRLGQPGSYLGHTETASDLTVANLVARLASGTYGAESVLGFDSHDYINRLATPTKRTVSNINLAGLPTPLYLGTASAAILSGNLTTTSNGADDYFFTGYKGGVLTVDVTLNGPARKVFVGAAAGIGAKNDSVVQLTQNNTYGGGTVLSSGTVYLGHPIALGSGPLSAEPWGDQVTLATSSTTTQVSNNIVLQYGDLLVYPYSPSGLTLTGVLSGSGRLHHLDGTLTLSGVNTFTGGVKVSSPSTLVVANSNSALGSGFVYLENAADLQFTTAAPVIGGLGGGSSFLQIETFFYSNVTLANGSTLTINQPYDESFEGTIQGSAALLKTGPGKLTLYGTNTYSAGTTITQGKLVAATSNALGGGAVLINGGSLGVENGAVLTNPLSFGGGGGSLGGSGIIGGSVSVGTLVSLSPGDSPGTLTFTSNLTWAPGGSYNLEVLSASGNSPGVSFDTVVVAGAGTFAITATSGAKFNLNLLSLSAALTPGNVTDFNANNSYSWQIASSSSAIAGFSPAVFNINTTSPGNFTNALNGGQFSVSLGGPGGNTALFLNFTPIPEPSTWALLCSGVGLLALASRRRR